MKAKDTAKNLDDNSASFFKRGKVTVSDSPKIDILEVKKAADGASLL